MTKDLLVNALADDNLKHQIKWVHFGDGSQSEEIFALAHNLLDGRENLNYEFKGRKSKKEILNFYSENDISLFINCSDTEGIPVSVMEAMSYGIPAIARDVGCNREIVNNSCGALLPSTVTAADLVQGINMILSENKNIYNNKRTAARKTVCDRYNAEKNYDLFYNEIKSLLREIVNETDIDGV